MLTVRGIDLLLTLNNLITSDGFVVIDTSDILESLTGVTAEEIGSAMKELKVEGLIIIKLADNDEYCLKITEQGRNRAAEILAMREKKANAQVLRVIKDESGKTFVELQADNDDEKSSVEGQGENAENPIAVVDNKLKKKRIGLSSFIWGALGGIVTSVAAILTYVYAFAAI